MRKAIGWILMLCLLLGSVVPAFAKLEILEQPVTQTVPENGKVTFSFKVQDQKSITWIFVNPETGEETTAKNIHKIFKGLKVSNPNSKKMTLKNVPAGLHGWSLFARCKANGATVETDIVQILIEGMDIPVPATPEPQVTTEAQPEEVQVEAPAEADAQPEETQVETPTEPEAQPEETQVETPVETEAQPEETQVETPAETEAQPELTEEQQMSDDLAEEDPEAPIVTITGKDVLIYQIDAKGKPASDGADSMTFENSANFYVAPATEGEVQYWLFGDLRVEPAESVSGFTLRGITEDMTISVKQKKTSAATANLNYDQMCKVTCSNCFFTFLPDGLSYAVEGEVPGGAKITVIAGQGANLAKGYNINGEDGQQKNKVTFTFVVEGDVSFSMQQ